MYAPTGWNGTELGDIEVVSHDGAIHLFHLTLPGHDVVGHAVSRDGLRWEALPPAIHTGPPGAFDDDQIWTVGIVEHAGRFHMLYTALSRAERGRVPRVGLATSDDLVRWEKHPEPVSEADARHYEAALDDAPWVAWRDPKPARIGDRFQAVVCARGGEAPYLRRGVVGRFSSADLRTWRAEPPLFAPRQHVELECPQLFELDGRWFLTAAVIDERVQRYWVADGPEGPFRTPDDNRLAPPGHYAARVVRHAGEHLLFCWHDVPGRDETRPPWVERFVPAPLVLTAGTDGRIAAGPTAAWERYLDGPAAAVDPTSLSPSLGNPTASARDGVLRCEEGMEVFALAPLREPWIDAELGVDAPLAGLALGLSEDGGGIFVELARGERRARAVSLRRATADRRPWFERRVLAEAPYEPRDRMAVRLVHAGGELELVVDGRVVLSTGAHAPGPAGLFVVSGALRVDRLAVGSMTAP